MRSPVRVRPRSPTVAPPPGTSPRTPPARPRCTGGSGAGAHLEPQGHAAAARSAGNGCESTWPSLDIPTLHAANGDQSEYEAAPAAPGEQDRRTLPPHHAAHDDLLHAVLPLPVACPCPRFEEAGQLPHHLPILVVQHPHQPLADLAAMIARLCISPLCLPVIERDLIEQVME